MYARSGEKVVALDQREDHGDEVLFLTGSEWSRWQAPVVEKPVQPVAPAQTPASAREPAPDKSVKQALEQLREQAYREGYERGLKEGRAAGEADIQAQKQQWQTLISAMTHPLEQLDKDVTYQLVLLTSAIAGAVVQHDVSVNPMQIVEVVRRAVAVMPAESRNLAVHVHHEDAKLLREAFSDQNDRHWSIIENPDISRGGCEVHSDTSRVDERVETRLAKVVEEVMGGIDGGDAGRKGRG